MSLTGYLTTAFALTFKELYDWQMEMGHGGALGKFKLSNSASWEQHPTDVKSLVFSSLVPLVLVPAVACRSVLAKLRQSLYVQMYPVLPAHLALAVPTIPAQALAAVSDFMFHLYLGLLAGCGVGRDMGTLVGVGMMDWTPISVKQGLRSGFL
jgi:hypothetical protein